MNHWGVLIAYMLFHDMAFTSKFHFITNTPYSVEGQIIKVVKHLTSMCCSSRQFQQIPLYFNSRSTRTKRVMC